MTNQLDADDLAAISKTTVGHYNSSSSSFWEGTKDHDVSQNISALLQSIDGDGPHTVLDFGCGPGRDLATFKALGHCPVGLEGSPNFCKMAREYSQCEVWNQDFLKLELPAEFFDGVFANATMFHVPAQELPRVLRDLNATLKVGGIFFSSNPRGANEEGWNGDRYGSYHNFEAWTEYMNGSGFTLVDYYYRPAGLPREEQPWLASIWRKNG
jgi:SAM-dependent methyltransferase